MRQNCGQTLNGRVQSQRPSDPRMLIRYFRTSLVSVLGSAFGANGYNGIVTLSCIDDP